MAKELRIRAQYFVGKEEQILEGTIVVNCEDILGQTFDTTYVASKQAGVHKPYSLEGIIRKGENNIKIGLLQSDHGSDQANTLYQLSKSNDPSNPLGIEGVYTGLKIPLPWAMPVDLAKTKMWDQYSVRDCPFQHTLTVEIYAATPKTEE